MFSYYGSKSKIVQYYPSPTCDKIIEPFAGSARYSLRYFDKDVLLVDKYKVIVDIWHYLQRASQKDILGLPTIKENDCVANYKSLSEVEKNFVGFYIKTGQPIAALKASNRTIIHRPKLQDYQKKNIASNLYKIKHWKIILGSYEDLENENATWFIDPPYQFGGHSYKESNKNLDFTSLANWCKSRNGQVIVCENTKATWMNFIPVIQTKGSRFKTTEAIWTNFPTQYDSIQQDLFGRGEEKISA
jgi:16S rRNA G966 N2-methylase RsmD